MVIRNDNPDQLAFFWHSGSQRLVFANHGVVCHSLYSKLLGFVRPFCYSEARIHSRALVANASSSPNYSTSALQLSQFSCSLSTAPKFQNPGEDLSLDSG